MLKHSLVKSEIYEMDREGKTLIDFLKETLHDFLLDLISHLLFNFFLEAAFIQIRLIESSLYKFIACA